MLRTQFLCFAVWASLAGASAVAAPAPVAADASPEPDPDRLRLALAGPGQVSQHARIEFTIAVPHTYRNPHDPAEVEVSLEVSTPSGRKLPVPAFFHQPVQWRRVARGDRPADWFHPTGQPGWRARFAPEEAGGHTAIARVRDATGERRSAPTSFNCTARPGRGYVRVSHRDPRFFEFDDGTPFFPLGQNVAFIGAGQYLDTTRATEVFRRMAANGANFARVWTCCEDWALAIEARKSAWGRSWSWNPPFAPLPGSDGYHSDELCLRLDGTNARSLSVSPTQPVALRPGTEYRLTGRLMAEPDTALVLEWNRGLLDEPVRGAKRGEWTRFQRGFTTSSNQWWLGELALRVTGPGRVWLRGLSLKEAEGGPELLEEADPRRPARGHYSQLDCAMLDRLLEAAERSGVYLQLCLLTRDHYRFALSDPRSAEYAGAVTDAQKLLRYAVARWGWSPHVFAWEYFNEMDPGAPTERFHRELGEYLERVDPWRHLRTTSGWGPAPKHWEHPRLDIADLHWYLRPAWGRLWQDEVAAVLDRAALVRRHAANRPAVLGEFGLADDKWGRSPYMTQDRDGVHMHNALWASAFSGLSAAASFWWWETLDQQDAYRHYRPLARFLADVPFTTAKLRAVCWTNAPGTCRMLAWQGDDRAYAWLFNPQATWWNQVQEKKAPGEVKAELSLDGLVSGTYRVEWWDTREGRAVGGQEVVLLNDVLRLNPPPFTSDLACKVIRQGGVK